MNGPTELAGVQHLMSQGGEMPDQSMPAGVPELDPLPLAAATKLYSGEDYFDRVWDADQLRAAYALGARRGYEAGLEAAAKVCEPHLFIARKPPGDYIEGQNRGIEKCLDAIRQLKGKQ